MQRKSIANVGDSYNCRRLAWDKEHEGSATLGYRDESLRNVEVALCQEKGVEARVVLDLAHDDQDERCLRASEDICRGCGKGAYKDKSGVFEWLRKCKSDGNVGH